LIAELQGFRRSLSQSLKGKGVLIGWTATAAIADFVPTSLHEKCPGVVVHGVIFNGIMTGEMWRRAPWWVAAVAATALGLITALAVGWFSPVRAVIVAGTLVVGYALLNGVVLFDYGNRIVDAAGPLTTVAVVWGGCTLTRVMVEGSERKKITQRFSSYNDPKLVDYVLENPDLTFEGEDREVTVVFTDLAGFTSLSERLGKRIVVVLNQLLGELVPVIRDHHQGYVNKFLGDGIMFFYNAPKKIDTHATDAVASVLDMHKKLAEFNIGLREQDLPELAMRAGIATGIAIVGDAGGGGRNDYTALGDSVNLSARLEPANKVVGTHTLMNDRAFALLDGKFLVRPIGRLQVVGQEQAAMCYEPISRSETATEPQRHLAEATTKMVEAFVGGCFEQCVSHTIELETICGPCKLTALYRGLCEQYLRDGKPANFDGRIILTSK
jgi:adenylate cyclase